MYIVSFYKLKFIKLTRLFWACHFNSVTIHHNIVNLVNRQLTCGDKNMLQLYIIFVFEMGSCYQIRSGSARTQPVGNQNLILWNHIILLFLLQHSKQIPSAIREMKKKKNTVSQIKILNRILPWASYSVRILKMVLWMFKTKILIPKSMDNPKYLS